MPVRKKRRATTHGKPYSPVTTYGCAGFILQCFSCISELSIPVSLQPMCNQDHCKIAYLLLQDARVVLGSWERVNAVKSLSESAQQCIRATELPEGALSMLESWLGPSEELAAHGNPQDMELMLVLRQYFPAGRVSP